MKHEQFPDPHHDTFSKNVFGFWVYLMTDFMMFAALFATYQVLKTSTFGGPSAKDLFSLSYMTIQMLFLLAASSLSGFASMALHRMNKNWAMGLFFLVFLFGFIFFWMQCSELVRLHGSGHSWKNSAFLSAYFTLIGTHAVHVFFALLWVPVLIIPLFWREIDLDSLKRLTCLRLFWQFLNVVWIFVFTVVYLMGGL